VIRCNSSAVHVQWAGRRGQTTEERKKERKEEKIQKGHELKAVT